MTEPRRPNIVLICVDQMRGDAMSAAGHPVVRTPWIDEIFHTGTGFSHAYSATPTCVPARVALFTGQAQESHGRYGYQEQIPFAEAHPVTMQRCLREAGYQTQAIGKMHVWPERSRCGFDDVRLHDGFLHVTRKRGQRHQEASDDYLTWLRRQPGMAQADLIDEALSCNAVQARPWDKPERLHPTNWVVSEALDWLQRRDPTVPFFLYLSFHRPHAPLDPPAWAFEQYLSGDTGEPARGDWVDDVAEHRVDHRPETQFGRQHPDVLHRQRAGYFGAITHIDSQLIRLVEGLAEHGLARDTAILFVSDHGDMLGDHDHQRKSVGYEGSARVPFLVKLPGNFPQRRGEWRDEVVELRDVMPTVLDIAGVEVPAGVDGRSVLPLVAGEQVEWRSHLHGEHTIGHYGCHESMHWVTDGHRKFCWFSGSGREQFFDLDADPHEVHNAVGDPERADEVALWRQRLVEALDGRAEGFVDNGRLVIGRPVSATAFWVPRASTSSE